MSEHLRIALSATRTAANLIFQRPHRDRHMSGNYPAHVGSKSAASTCGPGIELIDLPGVYASPPVRRRRRFLHRADPAGMT